MFLNRSDRAKAEKKKAKKRNRIILITVGLFMIGVVGLYLFTSFLPEPAGSGIEKYIDQEQSFARIDFFGNTYVYVFVKTEDQVVQVKVNDQPMNFNPAEGRWELVILGSAAGDELRITAMADGVPAGELILVVEELTLNDDG